MNELNDLVQKLDLSFIGRAIARELYTHLTESKTIGVVSLDVKALASDWGQDEQVIWGVIDDLQAADLWKVHSTADGTELHYPGLISSAKSIAKRKQRSKLKKLVTVSASDRAQSLTLNSVGPSSVSEVSTIIPREARKIALSGGYAGWLPASNFGVTGQAYRPDAGMLEALANEHPGLCIESNLAEMFEDLKRTKDRPAFRTFPFWIRRWFTENPKRLVRIVSDIDQQAMARQKLEEY